VSRVAVEPIAAEHLPAVAEFLRANLSSALSVAEWQAALQTHWGGVRPNHGFMLRDEGRIVGTICALYAERTIAGRRRSVCNIASWCVLDSHRKLSMKLAMAVVQQGGHDFTDFSPTAVVGGVLRFLNFRPLPDAQAVVFSVPRPAAGRVLTRPADIDAALSGDALQHYRDHARFVWLRHVAIGTPAAWCHVIYKPTRFKGLPAAKLLHVSDRALFRRHLGRWCNHMFARGLLTSHIECRMLPDRPWHSAERSGFNAKVFLSDALTENDIDYLYSETVALDIL
jgi:hypothetical protein